MVIRRILLFGAFAAAAAGALVVSTAAMADSPRGLVSKGNRQYAKKSFGEALEYYDKASVKAPESPIVALNKGAALYQQGDYAKAREQFKEAASKTKSLPFEAKAWYNLGNVAFREGERQEDSDLQKALASLEESVRSYVTALEKDPELDEAAENLEVARLKIKDLLDKLQKQQEEGGGQQQQQQEPQQQQGDQEDQQGGEDRQEGQERGDEDRERQAAEEQEKKDEESAADKAKEKPLERDETARQILDEERENRRERQRQEGRSRTRPVGKDW